MPSRRRSFRSGSRSRSGRPLRPLEWGGQDAAVNVPASSAAAAWILSPQDVRNNYAEPTLTRIRVLLTAQQVGASPAAPTISGLAYGVIAVTGDPDLATVPSIYPTPYTDPEADWVIHNVFPSYPLAAVNTVWNIIGADTLIWSKAQRRLNNETGLLFVLETLGVTFNANWNVRYLLRQ